MPAIARPKQTREAWETALSLTVPEFAEIFYREEWTKEPNVASDQVRVATMHRVKGLEFSRVILAGVRAETLPYHDAAYDRRDETARQLYDEGEKRLLYVAATRARDELRVSGWGTASPLL